MTEILTWLAGDSSASGIVIITICLLALLVAIIYMVAFWEGRAISFWPPRIGSRSPQAKQHQPNKPSEPPTDEAHSLPSPMRRDLLATTLGGIVIGTSATLLAASSPPRVRWRMSSVLDENVKNVLLYQAPKMVCDRVRVMSKGDFIIDVEPGGNTKQILQDVSNGIIECGYSGIYYNDDQYKVLFFGAAIPFGLHPHEQNVWLNFKKDPDSGLTYMQEIYKRVGLNVIPFPAGGTGGQMGGWFNKKIETVGDFSGLTMRIPGLGAEVLRTYFEVQPDLYLPGGPLRVNEIAKKLADGILDAAEWTGPYDDMQLGLHKVAKYCYYPGWWETGTTFDVQVNEEAWLTLPDHFKEILRTACQATHVDILALYEKRNSEALQDLMSLRTVEILPYNDEILAYAKARTADLLEFYAAKNELFGEVYDEWRNVKASVQQWSQLQR